MGASNHQNVVEYTEAILPPIVASCSSYIIFVAITRLGIGPIWHFPQYSATDIDDFVMAIGVGIIGAVMGWIFIVIFRYCERFFKFLKCPIYIKTTVAGLGLGILAFLFPLTRYFGEHQLEGIIEGKFMGAMLIGLAFAKMWAIAITVTGGWRGGIIIPLFFVGACFGKALMIAHPEFNEALVMVCSMAAINATVTRTLISTTLLLSKLTGFSSLAPILFASLVGFFLAPRKPFIPAFLTNLLEKLIRRCKFDLKKN